MNVKVFITKIDSGKLFASNAEIPQVKISTNLDIISLKKTDDWACEGEYKFSVYYTPNVGNIWFKGTYYVTGKEDEINNIVQDYKRKKYNNKVVQSISNIVFLESVIICRILQIPPPIPLPKVEKANR